MTLAAALALLAAAPLTEQRIRLQEPRVDGGTAVYRLPAIAHVGERFVRLAAPGAVRAVLNGSTLAARADGLYDLPYLARENTITVTPAQVSCELLVTTRVYVESARVEAAHGRLRAAVSVRNMLENTSNVYVTVTLGGVAVHASGTVPPGGASQMVSLEGAAGAGAEAVVAMEKEPEAMEGGYVFEVRVPVMR